MQCRRHHILCILCAFRERPHFQPLNPASTLCTQPNLLHPYFPGPHQIYVGIPGQASTPHVDANPRPYQFTAFSPARPRNGSNAPGAVPLMPDG